MDPALRPPMPIGTPRPSARPRLLALCAGLVASVGLFACAGPDRPAPPPTADGARERALFDDVYGRLSGQDGAAGVDPAFLDELEASFERIVAWHEAGELRSAAQRYWAGATLVRSDEPTNLLLAEALGTSAAILGEPRGGIVKAEARDRMAVLLGEPQPYGTQSVYVPVLGRWRLYAVDPATTDEERRVLGLPPLAQLQADAEARNEADLTRRLRESTLKPMVRPR
jgi:hypothetical protein